MFSLAALGIPPQAAAGPSSGSPLGKYADLVTAFVSLFVIVAAFIGHLGFGGVHPDAFTDSVALIAVGVLYGTARGVAIGQSSQTAELTDRANLNTKLVLAAHERLDQIAAPPAPIDRAGTGVLVGNPDSHNSERI